MNPASNCKERRQFLPGASFPSRVVPIVNSLDPDSYEKVSQFRIDGVPCILEGAIGWTQFADAWLKEKISGQPEVCPEKFCAQLGDAQVPILEKNYDKAKPITRTTRLRDFVNYAWKMDWPGLYLHQWQFPTTTDFMNLTSESGAHIPSPALGVDLLEHIHSSRKPEPNPLQYLFMGAASTKTHLHFDDGGLCITIAPIVGKKECWLVHRDDGEKVEKGEVDVENPDFEKYPQFATARLWHVILKPGQVLVMPHGTWHACRNVTPCLSYTRLHLDLINLQAFGNALLRGESPDAVDKFFLWNAAEWLISQVDKMTKQSQKEMTAKKNLEKQIKKSYNALKDQVLNNEANEIVLHSSNNFDFAVDDSLMNQSSHNCNSKIRKIMNVDHVLCNPEIKDSDSISIRSSSDPTLMEGCDQDDMSSGSDDDGADENRIETATAEFSLKSAINKLKTPTSYGVAAPNRDGMQCHESLIAMRHVIHHIDMCTEDINKCVRSSQWGTQWSTLCSDIDRCLHAYSTRFRAKKRRLNR